MALKKAAGGLATPTRQRNAAAMIAGLAFIVIAGAIGASVASSFDDSIDVLVAANEIQEGQPISASDFRTVQIAAGDGDIQAVSPASIDDLIGRVAAGPIGEGSMIHPSQFAVAFGEQQIVVGAALDPDQYPAGGLQVGDQVRLIALASTDTGIGFGSSSDDTFVAGQEITVGEISDVVALNNGTNLHFSIRVPESSANVVVQLVALNRLSVALLDESIDVDTITPLAAANPVNPLTLDEDAGE